jgi:hypothetical protein
VQWKVALHSNFWFCNEAIDENCGLYNAALAILQSIGTDFEVHFQIHIT